MCSYNYVIREVPNTIRNHVELIIYLCITRLVLNTTLNTFRFVEKRLFHVVY